MEFTSFIAADDEELGQKKTKTSQKVVNSASQMKDIYTPWSDFMQNKFGKRLIEGIIK